MEMPKGGDPVLVVITRKDGQAEVQRARVERVGLPAGTTNLVVAFSVCTVGMFMAALHRDEEGVVWCRGWEEDAQLALEAAWRLANLRRRVNTVRA
jgi:hypothetical protein